MFGSSYYTGISSYVRNYIFGTVGTTPPSKTDNKTSSGMKDENLERSPGTNNIPIISKHDIIQTVLSRGMFGIEDSNKCQGYNYSGETATVMMCDNDPVNENARDNCDMTNGFDFDNKVKEIISGGKNGTFKDNAKDTDYLSEGRYGSIYQKDYIFGSYQGQTQPTSRTHIGTGSMRSKASELESALLKLKTDKRKTAQKIVISEKEKTAKKSRFVINEKEKTVSRKRYSGYTKNVTEKKNKNEEQKEKALQDIYKKYLHPDIKKTKNQDSRLHSEAKEVEHIVFRRYSRNVNPLSNKEKHRVQTTKKQNLELPYNEENLSKTQNYNFRKENSSSNDISLNDKYKRQNVRKNKRLSIITTNPKVDKSKTNFITSNLGILKCIEETPASNVNNSEVNNKVRNQDSKEINKTCNEKEQLLGRKDFSKNDKNSNKKNRVFFINEEFEEEESFEIVSPYDSKYNQKLDAPISKINDANSTKEFETSKKLLDSKFLSEGNRLLTAEYIASTQLKESGKESKDLSNASFESIDSIRTSKQENVLSSLENILDDNVKTVDSMVQIISSKLDPNKESSSDQEIKDMNLSQTKISETSDLASVDEKQLINTEEYDLSKLGSSKESSLDQEIKDIDLSQTKISETSDLASADEKQLMNTEEDDLSVDDTFDMIKSNILDIDVKSKEMLSSPEIVISSKNEQSVEIETETEESVPPLAIKEESVPPPAIKEEGNLDSNSLSRDDLELIKEKIKSSNHYQDNDTLEQIIELDEIKVLRAEENIMPISEKQFTMNESPSDTLAKNEWMEKTESGTLEENCSCSSELDVAEEEEELQRESEISIRKEDDVTASTKEKCENISLEIEEENNDNNLTVEEKVENNPLVVEKECNDENLEIEENDSLVVKKEERDDYMSVGEEGKKDNLASFGKGQDDNPLVEDGNVENLAVEEKDNDQNSAVIEEGNDNNLAVKESVEDAKCQNDGNLKHKADDNNENLAVEKKDKDENSAVIEEGNDDNLAVKELLSDEEKAERDADNTLYDLSLLSEDDGEGEATEIDIIDLKVDENENETQIVEPTSLSMNIHDSLTQEADFEVIENKDVSSEDEKDQSASIVKIEIEQKDDHNMSNLNDIAKNIELDEMKILRAEENIIPSAEKELSKNEFPTATLLENELIGKTEIELHEEQDLRVPQSIMTENFVIKRDIDDDSSVKVTERTAIIKENMINNDISEEETNPLNTTEEAPQENKSLREEPNESTGNAIVEVKAEEEEEEREEGVEVKEIDEENSMEESEQFYDAVSDLPERMSPEGHHEALEVENEQINHEDSKIIELVEINVLHAEEHIMLSEEEIWTKNESRSNTLPKNGVSENISINKSEEDDSDNQNSDSDEADEDESDQSASSHDDYDLSAENILTDGKTFIWKPSVEVIHLIFKMNLEKIKREEREEREEKERLENEKKLLSSIGIVDKTGDEEKTEFQNLEEEDNNASEKSDEDSLKYEDCIEQDEKCNDGINKEKEAIDDMDCKEKESVNVKNKDREKASHDEDKPKEEECKANDKNDACESTSMNEKLEKENAHLSDDEKDEEESSCCSLRRLECGGSPVHNPQLVAEGKTVKAVENKKMCEVLESGTRPAVAVNPHSECESPKSASDVSDVKKEEVKENCSEINDLKGDEREKEICIEKAVVLCTSSFAATIRELTPENEESSIKAVENEDNFVEKSDDSTEKEVKRDTVEVEVTQTALKEDSTKEIEIFSEDSLEKDTNSSSGAEDDSLEEKNVNKKDKLSDERDDSLENDFISIKDNNGSLEEFCSIEENDGSSEENCDSLEENSDSSDENNDLLEEDCIEAKESGVMVEKEIKEISTCENNKEQVTEKMIQNTKGEILENLKWLKEMDRNSDDEEVNVISDESDIDVENSIKTDSLSATGDNLAKCDTTTEHLITPIISDESNWLFGLAGLFDEDLPCSIVSIYTQKEKVMELSLEESPIKEMCLDIKWMQHMEGLFSDDSDQDDNINEQSIKSIQDFEEFFTDDDTLSECPHINLKDLHVERYNTSVSLYIEWMQQLEGLFNESNMEQKSELHLSEGLRMEESQSKDNDDNGLSWMQDFKDLLNESSPFDQFMRDGEILKDDWTSSCFSEDTMTYYSCRESTSTLSKVEKEAKQLKTDEKEKMNNTMKIEEITDETKNTEENIFLIMKDWMQGFEGLFAEETPQEIVANIQEEVKRIMKNIDETIADTEEDTSESSEEMTDGRKKPLIKEKYLTPAESSYADDRTTSPSSTSSEEDSSQISLCDDAMDDSVLSIQELCPPDIAIDAVEEVDPFYEVECSPDEEIFKQLIEQYNFPEENGKLSVEVTCFLDEEDRIQYVEINGLPIRDTDHEFVNDVPIARTEDNSKQLYEVKYLSGGEGRKISVVPSTTKLGLHEEDETIAREIEASFGDEAKNIISGIITQNEMKGVGKELESDVMTLDNPVSDLDEIIYTVDWCSANDGETNENETTEMDSDGNFATEFLGKRKKGCRTEFETCRDKLNTSTDSYSEQNRVISRKNLTIKPHYETVHKRVSVSSYDSFNDVMKDSRDGDVATTTDFEVYDSETTDSLDYYPSDSDVLLGSQAGSVKQVKESSDSYAGLSSTENGIMERSDIDDTLNSFDDLTTEKDGTDFFDTGEAYDSVDELANDLPEESELETCLNATTDYSLAAITEEDSDCKSSSECASKDLNSGKIRAKKNSPAEVKMKINGSPISQRKNSNNIRFTVKDGSETCKINKSDSSNDMNDIMVNTEELTPENKILYNATVLVRQFIYDKNLETTLEAIRKHTNKLDEFQLIMNNVIRRILTKAQLKTDPKSKPIRKDIINVSSILNDDSDSISKILRESLKELSNVLHTSTQLNYEKLVELINESLKWIPVSQRTEMAL